MGNENNKKEEKNTQENKPECVLTNQIIMDIIIFYNYEKKYESINNEAINNKAINNNYIYIVCGLINGFIEIYSILNNKFKLKISFQAHRDIISKIIQLKNNGYLLTSSFDNSLKIFKLSRNCSKEELIYIFYLNVIFNRVNDVMEMSYSNNIIISVLNHIINFPVNKNTLSDNKNNLSDYNFTKIEHQKYYLDNLLEIDKDIFMSLDDKETEILFFKVNLTEDIILIKTIELKDFDKIENDCENYEPNKKYIECLKPKYNCILLSDEYTLKIIDINYLELVSVFQIRFNNDSFALSYNQKLSKIFFFELNKIYIYNISDENGVLQIKKEEEKNVNNKYIININEAQKIINLPNNENKNIIYYKKYLMIIDLNNF